MNSSQKKIMKKFLSVILSLSILASFCSFGAMADGYEIVDDYVYYNVDFDEGGTASFWTGGKVTDTSLPHRSYGRLNSDSDNVKKVNVAPSSIGPTASGEGQGTLFRYSFDAKWVGNLPSQNANLFEFNYNKPDGNSDNYIPIQIANDGTVYYLDGGTYKASDVKIALDKWYTFAFTVKFEQNQYNTIRTTITVTDEQTGDKYTVVENIGRNNVVTFIDKLVIYRKAMGNAENAYLYVDNLKWARIKEAVPEISIAASVSGVTEIPAGNKVKFSYETLYASGILGANGGCVKVFNNGVQQGSEITALSGTFDVAVSAGSNSIVAEIYDSDGEFICASEEYTIDGISLSISETTPGFSVNFDDAANKGSFSGTGKTTSYAYDDPDTQRGEGKVAYRKYASTETSNLKYVTQSIKQNGVMQGRFFEISADIKSNAPTKLRNISLVYLDDFYKENPVQQGTSGSWINGIDISSTGELICYNSNGGSTGVYADLANWHNYKILVDNTPDGISNASYAYYFVDDVLICHRTISSNIKTIGKASFATTYDETNDIDFYLDNVTVRTYDVETVKETLSNLTVYQGAQRITSKSQIDYTKALNIKGNLTKVDDADESVDVYVAFVKENTLEKIIVANVGFDASTQSFEIPVEGLPTDISTGDYEIKLFVWDENLTPYYGPWYSVLK